MATEQEWACLRKRRYRSRHDAEKAARHAQVHFGRMRPYRCPFAGDEPHYHVGHRWVDTASHHHQVTDAPD